MSVRLQRWVLLFAFALPAVPVLGEVVARVCDLPGMSSSNNPVLFRAPGLQAATELPRRHLRYLWTFVPGIEVKSSIPNQLIHIDEHGFRQTPWNDSGHEGLRWMFLGDSMVFCWEAATGETFPDALVGIVCKQHGIETVASFNPGLPAHSSYQSLRILKGEFSRVKPDIVVFWGGVTIMLRQTGTLIRSMQSCTAGLCSACEKCLIGAHSFDGLEPSICRPLSRGLKEEGIKGSRTNGESIRRCFGTT